MGLPPCRRHPERVDDWIRRLRPTSPEREQAVADLRVLLLSAARFEGARRRGAVPHLSAAGLDYVAQRSADEALRMVLEALDDFGEGHRFEAWAAKFALREAAVALQRAAWDGRKLPTVDADVTPMAAGLREAIRHLTPENRELLLLTSVGKVPLDVLAGRLGTDRGALYRHLCSARCELRALLPTGGSPDGAPASG